MDKNRYAYTSSSTTGNQLYSRRPTSQNGARDYRYHPYSDPYTIRETYSAASLPPRGLYPRDPIGPPIKEPSYRDPYTPMRNPFGEPRDPFASRRVPPAPRPKPSGDRPYHRRYDIPYHEPTTSNPGVRGNQVFDESGRQHTYNERKTAAAPVKEPLGERRKLKKVYATNEEEFNNPQIALKYNKPYDAYEKFYQFIIDRPPNAFEQKVIKLMDTVFSQPGVKAKLIFLESEEDKQLQTLQGSVDCCKSTLVLDQNEEGEHVLSIDGEEICKGRFQNKQIAKNMLGEQALELLRRHCFYIIKKPDVYEDIDTDIRRTIEPGPGPSPFATPGSKAHAMMMKMGWAGKGLGAKEQGESRPVAEIIDQNVTRRGLGMQHNRNQANVFKEIARIFDEFKQSASISVLRFAPDFEKEERAYIHTLALKAGLKSKSEGVAPNRRITITKKLTRDELVHSLLLIGCESALYQLLIPDRFLHLWTN